MFRNMFARAIGGAVFAKDERRQRTEDELGLVGVVGGAANREILDRRRTAARLRPHVVELEAPRLRAAAAVGRDESAALAVARPDLTPHLGRDVP